MRGGLQRSAWQERGVKSSAALASDQHVGEIERKVQELEALRRTLLDLADHCHGDQRPECPILDDLAAAVPSTRPPLTLHSIERRK